MDGDLKDLKLNNASPVLTDPAPLNKSRLGIHSNLLPYSQQSEMFIPITRKKPSKYDDVVPNCWLDAMKSSSPSCKNNVIKDFAYEVASDDTEIAYCSWMLKYPSAIKSFKQITSNARDKKIAVFLDYDGTLSPIVDDPDRAFMSSAVFELVGITELYYAGSHGMDIICPVSKTVSNNHPNSVVYTDPQGKEVNIFQPAREFLPMIDEVFRTLVENTKGINGAKVENHKFCASVHYRNVDEKNWPIIAECVHDILKDYPRLRLSHGRKVLEIRPVIDWNKGKAVEFLLESLGLNDRENVLPIYIGDDKTDEDAFKVLREMNRGYGILVSSTPKESKAYYSLKDTSEVMEFLKSLVRWKQEEAE